MDAQIAKNLTRADIVRLLSRQVLEDRETDLAESADAVSKARDAFLTELRQETLAIYDELLGQLCSETLSDRDILVRADYELRDDELDQPQSMLVVVLSDGPAHQSNFTVRVPVALDGHLAEFRQAWISATHRANAAILASRKLADVAKDARIQVIQEALESTEAGRKVLALLPDVRAEAGRALCE